MASLVPVLVRTFGRTGSTLLMQILGTNRRVVFERHYPFEHRYLTYCYQLARMVKVPPRAVEGWNNDVLFQSRFDFVSGLPYGSTDSIDKDKLSQRLFVSSWEQFSLTLREANNFVPGQAVFYAEKAPHQVAAMANELLNARNIYLLRDPRDEMVSIMSFNQKRGFNSFGWTDNDNEVSYAQKLCRNRRKFLHQMIDGETEHSHFHVRYEDLIHKGQAEVDRMSEWLGANMSFKKAMENKDIRNRHMTSRNSKSSVERWRKELSTEAQDIFKKELGEELSSLGYQV